MQLRRNHSTPRRSASWFHSVGDRAAHHGDGAGQGRVVSRLHQRHRRQHRHGGLAHRHHVQVGPERPEHLHDVVDVIIEIEAPGRDRHHAGVGPVGDEDLVVRQESLDGAAQQRRVMARHRRHDQHLGLVLAAGRGAVEGEEPAERLRPNDALRHGYALAFHQRGGEAEGGLQVAPGAALEQLAAGRDGAAIGGGAERIGRVGEQQLGHLARGAGRRKHGMGGVIQVVSEVHRDSPPGGPGCIRPRHRHSTASTILSFSGRQSKRSALSNP